MSKLSTYQSDDFQDAEMLRVLGKGMVTIPKSWRDELFIMPGDLVRSVKTEKGIFIEPMSAPAPYRIYSKKELAEFLKKDKKS